MATDHIPILYGKGEIYNENREWMQLKDLKTDQNRQMKKMNFESINVKRRQSKREREWEKKKPVKTQDSRLTTRQQHGR